MKKYTLHVLLAVPVLLIAFVLFNYKTEVANAIGSIIRSGANVPINMRTSSSSTTPSYMLTGTATTTKSFESENFSSLAVYMNVVASSTSGAFNSVLNIKPQASDDNIDWFDYDFTTVNPQRIYAATSSIALASSTVDFSWLPSTVGQNATSSKAFSIPIIPARYTRLVFTLVASTTPWTQRQSVALWVNIIGKIE